MMLTKEQLNNLEVIFTLARQTAVNNEEQLIAIINYKKELFDIVAPKEKETEKETEEVTEKSGEIEPVNQD